MSEHERTGNQQPDGVGNLVEMYAQAETTLRQVYSDPGMPGPSTEETANAVRDAQWLCEQLDAGVDPDDVCREWAGRLGLEDPPGWMRSALDEIATWS